MYRFLVVTGEHHYILTGLIDIMGLYPVFEKYEVIPETVGQLADTPDKHSRKVYEGDIVKWTSLYIKGEAIGVVTFFDSCWFIQGEKHNGRLNDCLTCEVIGNIHDNPELLKEV